MHKIKIIEGFIDPEDCIVAQNLIDNSELIPFKYNNNTKQSVETPEIYSFIKKYSKKAIEIHKKIFNIYVDIYPTHSSFNLWEEKSVSGVHTDNHSGTEYIQLTTVSYFNNEFDGGEIYFPEFDFIYKPKAGDGLFFPAFTKDFKYEHGVKEITKGKRYTMGLWFSQFEKFANKELL